MMTSEAILARNEWTPELFREALRDLDKVEEGESSPELEQSMMKTLKMLAAHLTHMRLLGRVSVLRGYATMLGDLLMRHPRLPRLRHLTFSQRVGVRMEFMIEDVLQAEALPTLDKAKAALTGERSAVRRRIIEKLMEGEWVSTSALVDATATTRQNVHLILPSLVALGLIVTRKEKGQHLHRCTDLAHRAMAQIRQPRSIFTMTKKEDFDSGIKDGFALMFGLGFTQGRMSAATR
jgi:hypothetical protein